MAWTLQKADGEEPDECTPRDQQMLVCLRAVLVLGVTLVGSLRGQVEEYQLKAFFLYNFAKYVEWPSRSFKAANDPIVICILGPNPFGDALEQAVRGKVVEGHPFVVRQMLNIEPSTSCHILFINSSERRRFRSITDTLRGSGVLTVGEARGFTSEGGVVNFKLEGGKVRFEINVDAAGREHLRISSKLLRLADITKE